MRGLRLDKQFSFSGLVMARIGHLAWPRVKQTTNYEEDGKNDDDEIDDEKNEMIVCSKSTLTIDIILQETKDIDIMMD